MIFQPSRMHRFFVPVRSGWKVLLQIFLLILSLQKSMGQTSQVPSYVPKNGLVGWWPFKGNAKDVSGNGNNGIVGKASLSTDRYGQPNSAFSFRGAGNSDHIKVPNSPSLTFKEMAISIWYKAQPGNGMDGNGNSSRFGNYALFAKEGDGIGTPPGFYGEIYYNQDGGYLGYYNNNGCCDSRIKQDSLLSFSHLTANNDTAWNHAVFVANKEEFRIYLNGALVRTRRLIQDFSGANKQNLYFGIYGFGALDKEPFWYPFNGKLDDIAIWNRTLSELEVKQLYQSNPIEETKLLVSDQSVACNQTVEVPVRVSRFRKMLSMQGTVAWDSKVLRFDSISNYGSSAMQMNASNFGLTQTANGNLFYSWNDASLGGVTLADSTVLFTMRFTQLSKDPAIATISFPDGPVATEFLDTTYQPVAVDRRSGNIALTFLLSGFNPLDNSTAACGKEVTLNAGNGFTQYLWSNGTREPFIRVGSSGRYGVEVRDAQGCIGRDSTTVSFIQADILQSDTSLCKGSSLLLRSNTTSRLRLQWSTGDTTSLITVRPDRETRYRLTVSDGAASCSDSVLIRIAVLDTSLRVQGPTTSCVGNDSLLIRAGTATRYQWLRNGLGINGQNNVDYRPDSSGSYRVALTDVFGCRDTSRAVVVVKNPLPKTTLGLTGDTLFCAGATRLLTATGGASYRWFRNDTLMAARNADTLMAAFRGRYTVQATNSLGCTSQAPNSVTLTDIPRAKIDFTVQGICFRKSTDFTNKSTWPERTQATWRWEFGNGKTDTAVSTKLIYDNAGTYRVRLWYQNGSCPSHTDSLSKLHVIVKDSAYRLNNEVAVRNIPKDLSARDTAKAWAWQPPTGLSSTNVYNPKATLVSAQQFLILTTLANGCTVTDTLLVKVADDTRIHVPKAFTPNGDGQNDRLFPILVGVDQLRFFRVYNRWGNLVYETRQSGMLGGWDGTYKGQPQAMDTFVWVAEGVDANGKTIKASGKSLLLR
jgi:gliding motility-associated-like protein